MAIDETSAAGRYVVLQDYVRVLRRYWLIIVALAVLGAALGYLAAKRQQPSYKATSSVTFTDPNQDLSVVGFGTNSVQTPVELAAAAEDTVTQPDVMNAARRRLKTKIPAGALAGAITPSVSATSGALQITATWSNPLFAAKLANAVAHVVTDRTNEGARASFDRLAKSIQGRISNLQHQTGGLPSAKSTEAGTQLLFYDNELAHIETVKQFARGAQIATVALPPGAPSSPNKTRNILLGGVLGLLLGVIFAFLRDVLDRRLRTPRDIESSFRLPVLGHVRDAAMSQIAYVTNGTRVSDRQLDIEAIRIVRRNLEFLADGPVPHSILVTSGLPEEGKTTVAGSLAFAMAAAGKSTLLVDCDLRRPTLASRLGLEQSPGISDFLVGRAEPKEILRTVPFADTPSRNGSAPTEREKAANSTAHQLVCVPAGSSVHSAAEALGSPKFKQFLEEVSEVYDIVILDSSPLLPVADTLEMLPHVDAVILCAREFKTTRAEASAARAALSRLPERPTGLVVTGVKPGRDEYYGSAYSHTA